MIGNSSPTCDYCHNRADAWHYSSVQHRYYSRTLKTWSWKPDLLWASCWNHLDNAMTDNILYVGQCTAHMHALSPTCVDCDNTGADTIRKDDAQWVKIRAR